MIEGAFALAFTAGLVASVNPCGFAMLPAYLSFLIGADDDPGSPAVAVGRALRVGATVSVGFIVVFGAAGVALTAGARWLTSALPWAALAVGAGLIVGGLIMVTGRSLPIRWLPTPTRGVSTRGTVSTALFGVSYAVASLSCTLPVFLVVIGGAGTQRSLLAGVATFGVYALGMALPLVGVAVALALGKDAAVRRIRGVARYATRLAGGLLVLAGAYIIFYWVTVLAPATTGGRGLVSGVEALSSRLTTLIGTRPLLWGALLGVLVVAALGYALRTRTETDADAYGEGSSTGSSSQ